MRHAFCESAIFESTRVLVNQHVFLKQIKVWTATIHHFSPLSRCPAQREPVKVDGAIPSCLVMLSLTLGFSCCTTFWTSRGTPQEGLRRPRELRAPETQTWSPLTKLTSTWKDSTKAPPREDSSMNGFPRFHAQSALGASPEHWPCTPKKICQAAAASECSHHTAYGFVLKLMVLNVSVF